MESLNSSTPPKTLKKGAIVLSGLIEAKLTDAMLKSAKSVFMYIVEHRHECGTI